MKATINSTDICAFKSAALLTKAGITMVDVKPSSIQFVSSKDCRKYTHSYKVYKDERGIFRLRRIIYDWQCQYCASGGKQEYQLGRTHYNNIEYWPSFSSMFAAIKWFEGYIERNKTRWIKAAAK